MSDDEDMGESESERIDRLIEEARENHPYTPKESPSNVAYIGPGWDDEERMRVILATNNSIMTEERRAETIQQLSDASNANNDDPFNITNLFDEPPSEPIKLFTIGQIEAIETEAPYLGDALLHPGGKVVVFGPPKSGKSQMAIQLLLNAACGGEWMSMPFDRAHKVIYCNAEIRAAYLHDRFEAILPTFDSHQQEMIRKNFLITGRGDISLKRDKARITEMLEEHKPTFLVLDPLTQFMEGIDENNNSEMSDLFTEVINPLVEADGGRELCLVLVHHSKKGANNMGFDGLRGASYLRGWYDSGIEVRPKTGNVELRFETRNGPPPNDQYVMMNTDTMRFEHLEVDLWADFRDQVRRRIGPEWITGNDLTDILHECADGVVGLDFGTWSKDKKKEARRKIADLEQVETIGKTSATKYRIKEEFRDSSL